MCMTDAGQLLWFNEFNSMQSMDSKKSVLNVGQI